MAKLNRGDQNVLGKPVIKTCWAIIKKWASKSAFASNISNKRLLLSKSAE